eukprot:CAMPEP_0168173220 /NCGR_PEP_ID=MMETSP0139_2-20121125/5752_1 /TAXON_ID=44445 /ORGANISM="Pseudo-nitzschia australis, Strain 10249 10 AB" /LENGTH=481 /DNA_ID=CAMNT_0008091085 /DNA_START=452 /DNA_END=1897 /DNA_ORIENTATION=-
MFTARKQRQQQRRRKTTNNNNSSSSSNNNSNNQQQSKFRGRRRVISGFVLCCVVAFTYYVYLVLHLDYTSTSTPSSSNGMSRTDSVGVVNPIANTLGQQKRGIQKQVSKDKDKYQDNDNDKDKYQDKYQDNDNDTNQDKDTNQITITVTLAGKQVEVPSAKQLLTSKPPFEDSDAITLDQPQQPQQQSLITSPNTVVTGYFRVRSKYHSSEYDGWMANMLRLQDAMVIFTEPALIDQIKELRSHAANRTLIVPVQLDDLPVARLYSDAFWQDQLDRDPEKRIHRSYQLFWIWLSKSWCVTQAMRMNVFQSDLFVWSDIGCFRRGSKFKFKTLVQHREVVPPNEMLQMAHHKPNPPPQHKHSNNDSNNKSSSTSSSLVLFNDKYKHGKHFYHSGSLFVGYQNTWRTFHRHFLETIDRFLENHMIVVEDQAVLQSTCLSHPELCAYAPFHLVDDNHYFGLRHVLHYGGKVDYWRYKPDASTTN